MDISQVEAAVVMNSEEIGPLPMFDRKVSLQGETEIKLKLIQHFSEDLNVIVFFNSARNVLT